MRLAQLYSTLYPLLYLLALGVLATYRIDRATHERNLSRVRRRKQNSRAAAMPHVAHVDGESIGARVQHHEPI